MWTDSPGIIVPTDWAKWSVEIQTLLKVVLDRLSTTISVGLREQPVNVASKTAHRRPAPRAGRRQISPRRAGFSLKMDVEIIIRANQEKFQPLRLGEYPCFSQRRVFFLSENKGGFSREMIITLPNKNLYV